MSKPTPFDPQPQLEDALLNLRPLERKDLEGLYAAANDPLIWKLHPIKDRHKRKIFEPYFEFLLENGGTLVARDRETSQIIGCSCYYDLPDAPNSISIGYTFLTRPYWGGPMNAVMKALMLDHAFASFPTVWLHIDPDNIRSAKATEKIGGVYVKTAPTAIVGSKGEMMWYRINKANWESRTQTS